MFDSKLRTTASSGQPKSGMTSLRISLIILLLAFLFLTAGVVLASHIDNGPTLVSVDRTIWPESAAPAIASTSDIKPVELGVEFVASQNGSIKALRYFRSSENSGPHKGRLWSDDGTLLAEVTFTNETPSGWQEAAFATPIPILAGVHYVASYTAPNGRYSSDKNVFGKTGPIKRLELTALRGLYSYDLNFPRDEFEGSNYYVDVVFSTLVDHSSVQSVSESGVNPEVEASYPDASKTGVPEGSSLTASGSLVISSSGQVVDSVEVSGTITVEASDVTIKRTRVKGRGYAVIGISPGLTGVRIEDVEVDGWGLNGEEGSFGIQGPATILRTNIHGVENGVSPSSGSAVIDSFIHDLSAPGDPHIDGIQMDGDIANVIIEHNTIDMNEWDQTTTIMIDNEFGAMTNIDVRNNRLLGGGYTVYSDAKFTGAPITEVSFLDNRLGKGAWGYSLIRDNEVVWSGNVDDSSGRPVE